MISGRRPIFHRNTSAICWPKEASGSYDRCRLPARFVSRKLNLGYRKMGRYPADAIKLSDIATRILKLRRQCPDIPILMPNRDIDSAFRVILMRPGLIHILCTDTTGGRVVGRGYPLFGNLAMPSGWVASPAYLKIHTDEGSALRSCFRPPNAQWGGSEKSTCAIYVGACMTVGFPRGKRLRTSTDCWGCRCKQILDDDTINLEKRPDGGPRGERPTLLGFDVNTARMAVELHGGGEAVQARCLMIGAALSPGDLSSGMRLLGTLRGLCM